ncbi:hypothetical protein F7725_014935 [Dissostichus mawsoni]|uniref:C2 domain-containing protein n=1 Tax=Dissostichus mawsoni TaxID=36200 RepID=A0A7J5YJH5_DISMA|nr:hypothetical protein F7725_014935 [Dissostichus mawsoni]
MFNLRARRLNSGILGTPDAYVKVFCGSANLGETSVRPNNRNPWWEEDFTYLDTQENDVMKLKVYDQDIWLDDLLGVCQRQIKLGTHEHECFLKKGGTLRYTYPRLIQSSIVGYSSLFQVAEAQLKLFNLRARRLNSGILGTPDAYVEVFCGSANLGETSVRPNNRNPWWEEDFTYLDTQENDMMRLEVHDQDMGWMTCLESASGKLSWEPMSMNAFLKKVAPFVIPTPSANSVMAEAQLKVFNLRASKLHSGILGTPDAYVEVFCGSANLGETSVRHNNRNPWWEEDFTYFNTQENDMMMLKVHDHDIGLDDLLGVCQRQIKLGTHEHECFLEEGGSLHYAYTLG